MTSTSTSTPATMSTPSELAIRCRGLVKRYPGKRGSPEVRAVNGLDLEVRRGQVALLSAVAVVTFAVALKIFRWR